MLAADCRMHVDSDEDYHMHIDSDEEHTAMGPAALVYSAAATALISHDQSRASIFKWMQLHTIIIYIMQYVVRS